MEIFYNIEDIPAIDRSVVAVGAFDGVHRGHQRVLGFLRDEAANHNAKSVVLTFNPHPRTVLHNTDSFFLINTMEENIGLIEQQGIDIAVVQPFTKEFSQISYNDFINDTIIGKLHAAALVMGPNHSLGYNRDGNHNKLKSSHFKNLKIIEIPEEMYNTAGVHSALIRKLISKKDWDNVDMLLGYEYKHKEKQPQ